MRGSPGSWTPDPSPLAPAALRDVAAGRPLDAAPLAFAFAALEAERTGSGPVLWVQDRASRREGGRLFEAGLRALLGLWAPILRVEANATRDALAAMEEGAGCAALSGVLGEVHGGSALDMTATKRLALRSRASGVPVWLVRSGGAPWGPSAARTRWRLASRPSAAHPHDAHAPGAALWEAELLRAPGREPGRWVAGWEAGDEPSAGGPQDRLRLAAAVAGGAAGRGGGRAAGALGAGG